MSREPEFFQMWGSWWNINNNTSFQFRSFPENCNVFQKIQKILFWGHFKRVFLKFDQKWILLEKMALSIFECSNYLPSCKKFKKTKTSKKECYGIFQKFYYTREHQNLQTKKRLRNFCNKKNSSQIFQIHLTKPLQLSL